MSYVTISSFVESGQKSLKDGNYWSALSIALSLPSMCSRLAFKGEPDKYRRSAWKDKTDHSKGKTYTEWKDKECYIDFCKELMRVHYGPSPEHWTYDGWIVSVLGNNFPEVLYQLRCDIIHAGTVNISDGAKGIYLLMGETSSTEFSRYKVINIASLCRTIFWHVTSWCTDNSVDNFKYTRVFDVDHDNDDRILYNRLCERERADYLEEVFIEENSNKGESN